MFTRPISYASCYLLILLMLPLTLHAQQSSRTDPTKPPSAMLTQLAPVLEKDMGFELTAVFKRKSTLYAVINGEVLAKGASLNGMKVEKISLERVILTPNDSEQEAMVLLVDNAEKLEKQVAK